mmetsp:Transcript_57763/g.153996  ORF Transcript_57763/g.153996 Transcript_57763/m.153996 type:complete len:277 (-) Transcript_57763:480-1310(-)
MMWRAGDWTDDTDQQVLLLQSLLATGGRAEPQDFARRLLTWREKGFPQLGDESGAGLGQATKAVLNDPKFLESPHEVAVAHTSHRPTNGGVMRTAAAGLPSFWDDEAVVSTSKSMCQTTHADPRCVASCVAVSLCVARLLRGDDLVSGTECVVDAALQRSQEVLRIAGVDPAELLSHARSRDLPALSLDEPRTIGYTYKCLGSGFWALRSTTGFQDTLNKLIPCGGDADTNGAVAGALLGCRLGYSALPADWVAAMPYSSWLEAHAQKVLFMLGCR